MQWQKWAHRAVIAVAAWFALVASMAKDSSTTGPTLAILIAGYMVAKAIREKS